LRRATGSVIRAPIGLVSPTPGTDTIQPSSVLVAAKPPAAPGERSSSVSSVAGTTCACTSVTVLTAPWLTALSEGLSVGLTFLVVVGRTV
jgi:hypothetical protein